MSKFIGPLFKIFSAFALCISGLATAACPLPGIDVSANPAGTGAELPGIGMADDGTAIAVWILRNEDGPFDLVSSSFLEKGGSWSSPQTVIQSPLNSTGALDIAVSKVTGNAVAVWEQADPDTPTLLQVFASARPFDTGIWTTPIRVDVGDMTNNRRVPKIAINTVAGNDYAVVIWQNTDSSGSTTILESSQLNFVGFTPGTWSSPIQVFTQTGALSTDQELVVDSTGITYAIWAVNSSSAVDIQTASLPFNGVNWDLLQNFSPLSFGGEKFLRPKIALGSSGFIAASWIFRVTSIDYNVQTSRFESGAWIAPDTITNSASSFVNEVNISADIDNNLAVIWTDSSGPLRNIKSSYRPFSSGMWSATPLQVSNVSPTKAPDIVLISGVAHATWVFRNVNFLFEVAYASSLNGAAWTTPCVGISSPTADVSAPYIVGDPTQYVVIIYDNVDPASPIFSNIYATAFLPPPTVTSVSPTSGSINGQNFVLITGTNFFDVQSVQFGLGNPSPSFIVISPSQILAIAPSGPLAPPSVDVIVTTDSGASSTNPGDLYSFIDPICWQR